ncbi:MAG: ATP-binding protein [bacterium]
MIYDKFSQLELQSHNLWWIRQELIHEDTKIIEFEQQTYQWFHAFYSDFPLQEDAILTLRGPRQVGKTTFLKLLIRRLLIEDKIPRQAIFFYSCDRIKDYDELFYLLTAYLDFVKARISTRIFIFLDEISFVREWQRAIKALSDSGRLKNTLLLFTGSNILDIKFSSERLPGRRGKIFKPDIEILPLDFSEFLRLIKPEFKQREYHEIFSMHFAELQKYFEDFLLTGGYLANINNYYSLGFIPSYMYEIYFNWIEGDLHKAGKSDDTALKIFDRLRFHLTSPISFYKLARESGVSSHLTISDYLDILEKMFVLFKTEYFSIEQKRTDSKKNRKLYFYDPFIFQVVLTKMDGFLDDAYNYSRRIMFEETFRPKAAEMLVGSFLRQYFNQLYYGSSSLGEVDFVGKAQGKYSFFEVKYQNRLQSKEFYKFKNLLKKITIITKTHLVMEGDITLVPLEIFLAFKENFI